MYKGLRYTIKKWWFNRLKNNILREQNFTKKDILKNVIELLKYSFSPKQKIEIHISNFRDYITVSNNDFISKTYIYALDRSILFEKSKIIEHLNNIFDDDKLIIIVNNQDYLSLAEKYSNVYIIQIESLKAYKKSFQLSLSNEIKDLNYLYTQLDNII
jgi:hypothetical protein